MCSLYRSKCSNLKLAEAAVGRDQKVVKKSGRDEPMWVTIHMCMEAMLGISFIAIFILN
jgi:hypothetical protein